MNKGILLIILLLSSITIILVFVNQNKTIIGEIESSNIILFYSEYCGHCNNVKDYIDENRIEDKISFKMIDSNKNPDLLFEKATLCGLDFQTVRVPFLFDGQNCLMGDKNIIEFFNSKLK